MHDTFQVINDAVKMEACSTMNGSAITSKDTNAMLTCMRKVNRPFERTHEFDIAEPLTYLTYPKQTLK